jgi:hypothetical protein
MEQTEEFPPWTAGADESTPPDHSKFANCENVLSHIAAATNETVVTRHYTLSKRWGYILRATAVLEQGNVKLTSLINCWSPDGKMVQMASMFGGPP